MLHGTSKISYDDTGRLSDHLLFYLHLFLFISHLFHCRQTRTVFHVALKVHQNIQKRNIEVGRNLGYWILRWLDRMKPSAQIRGSPPPGSTSNQGPSMSLSKETKSYTNKNSLGNFTAPRNGDSADRHVFSSRIMWSRPLSTIATMMRPGNPVGSLTQHRHCRTSWNESPMQQYVRGKWDGSGFIRKDIMQWMQQK